MENYSSLNIRGCEVTGANVSCLTRKYQDKFSKQFLTTRKLHNAGAPNEDLVQNHLT